MRYFGGRLLSFQRKPFLFFRVEVGRWQFFISRETGFMLCLRTLP